MATLIGTSPLTGAERNRKYRLGHLDLCRQRAREAARKHRAIYPEAYREWCAKNPEKRKEINRRYRQRHPDRVKESDRLRRLNNPELVRMAGRKWQKKLKQQIIEAYGGKCVCCQENRFEFMSIDHINGNGARERKAGYIGGGKLYTYLKRSAYPKENYRLLCINCNFSLGHYGYCPHSKEA